MLDSTANVTILLSDRMNRIASALLLGGGVLLTTWVVAPAAPAPSAKPLTTAEVAALTQQAPIVAEVDAQVTRLRERLAAAPQFPPPSRNPFLFGRGPEPASPKVNVPVIAAPAPVEPDAAAPTLPRIVAVIGTATDGGLLRTAVLGIGDDVQIVKPGDVVLRFVVRSISADAVELVDPLSNATFRVVLR